MRRASLVTGLLIALVAPAAGADQLPVVPSPQGFIEASALSPEIRDRALAGRPASQKLIGIYYRADTLAKLLHDRHAEPAPWCIAYINQEFDSATTADEHFKVIVVNAKKEDAQKFDRSDPKIDHILKHYEDITRDMEHGTMATVNGLTPLGTIAETNSYYAFSMITMYTLSSGQQSVKMPFAIAAVWMRLGTRIISLSALYPFLDRTSIDAANDTLVDWLNQTVLAN